MSRTGLYVGGFAPFHKGHAHCIDTALEECDEVIVCPYWMERINVPLQRRAGWIEQRYYDEPVHVIEAWAGPTDTGYSERLKAKHEQYAIELLNRHGWSKDDIDAYYCSEPYGDHMSTALDAEDRRVDQDRSNITISGTQIRNDPYSNREYLHDRVYSDLIQRIAVVGGVSTGKTTLAKALADEYDTEWQCEVGDEFWREHADEDGRLTERELYHLAGRHMSEEYESTLDADTYLFVDTTPLTTMAWSKYYHNSVHRDLRSAVASESERYDLHVLCDDEIDFEPKDGREGEQNRKRLQRMHRALLEEYGIDYIEVTGGVTERIRQVENALDEIRPVIPN